MTDHHLILNKCFICLEYLKNIVYFNNETLSFLHIKSIIFILNLIIIDYNNTIIQKLSFIHDFINFIIYFDNIKTKKNIDKNKIIRILTNIIKIIEQTIGIYSNNIYILLKYIKNIYNYTISINVNNIINFINLRYILIFIIIYLKGERNYKYLNYQNIINLGIRNDLTYYELQDYLMENYKNRDLFTIIYNNNNPSTIYIDSIIDTINSMYIKESPDDNIEKFIATYISGGKDKNNYKKTDKKITVIYKKKKYTRVIYINERKKYVKIDKTYMLLSKLKKDIKI
jgi:hypothetical protein